MKYDTAAAQWTRWIPKSQWSVTFPVTARWLIVVLLSRINRAGNPDSKHSGHQNTSSNWCKGLQNVTYCSWVTASNAWISGLVPGQGVSQTLLWFRVLKHKPADVWLSVIVYHLLRFYSSSSQCVINVFYALSHSSFAFLTSLELSESELITKASCRFALAANILYNNVVSLA